METRKSRFRLRGAKQTMKIFKSVQEMRSACRAAKDSGRRLGFAPTMGALHEGHLSLVRAAREGDNVVAVSIFVNPTQFGPNEDFSKYPRSFERDCELLEKEGVDLLFAPSVEEMYLGGIVTWVTVEGLSDKLCGRSRPGHFRGVTTVVAKFFNIIEPDLAFFGQKDAAQLAIIRRMVRDLHFPVQIVGCPIVREPDGLAMSSRNAYLDPTQRQSALALHRALQEIQNLFHRGQRNPERLISAGKQVILQESAVRLDYLELVDPDSLEQISQTAWGQPPSAVQRSAARPPGMALVAIAAFVGTTRLIDNIVLNPG
jgi:pantoate--beta-alanine ligase